MFSSRLGFVLLFIALKMFIFTRTQLKVNCDLENNIWRHLLNSINNTVDTRITRITRIHPIRVDTLLYEYYYVQLIHINGVDTTVRYSRDTYNVLIMYSSIQYVIHSIIT